MRGLALAGLGLVALIGITACQKKTDGAAATGEAANASAAAPANPLAPVGPPKRKPGLWTQTVSTRGVNQVSKICIDAATDAQMSAWGAAAGKDMCSKNVISPTAGGWKFEAVCGMGQGGTSSTTGEAIGDFNSKYVVKATTVTSGSSMPQANGTHAMELTATWEGPCPAGMKPGDMTMTLPGGRSMTMNITEMMAGAKGK